MVLACPSRPIQPQLSEGFNFRKKFATKQYMKAYSYTSLVERAASRSSHRLRHGDCQRFSMVESMLITDHASFQLIILEEADVLQRLCAARCDRQNFDERKQGPPIRQHLNRPDERINRIMAVPACLKLIEWMKRAQKTIPSELHH